MSFIQKYRPLVKNILETQLRCYQITEIARLFTLGVVEDSLKYNQTIKTS